MWRRELPDQRRISIRKAKICLLREIGERPKIVQSYCWRCNQLTALIIERFPCSFNMLFGEKFCASEYDDGRPGSAVVKLLPAP
jgi:hypothetical protein